MCGCNGGFPANGGPGTAVPAWTKFSVTHTQLQAAALTNSITLFSLEAGGVIHGVKLKHSVVFDGPGITDYFLSLGIAGATADLLNEYDVENTPVANDNFALSSVLDTYNHGATTAILLTARSVGANLDASTSGAAEIWVLLSRAI